MNLPSVFQFQVIVDYLRAWSEALPPGQKRGSYNRLARAAGVFPSYLSQIMRGDRHLNLDQAIGISEYLQLSSPERRYFFRLVELGRAQKEELRRELREELDDLRSRYYQLSSQVPQEKAVLSPSEMEHFYSSWVYVAIRLLPSIQGFQKSRVIARRLGLSEATVEQALRFLLKTGLCKEGPNGIEVGPTHMHLEHDSPLIRNHHANWRLRAIEKHSFLKPSEEIAYSFVATLSKEDANHIRDLVIDFAKNIRKISDPSHPEKLFCLNLDWFEV